MMIKFTHWLCFLVGITMIAAPVPENSVWLVFLIGATGGLLTLFGIEGIVRDLLKEHTSDSRSS